MTDVGGMPLIQTGGSDSMGSNWIWAFLLFALLGRGGFGGSGGGGAEKALFDSQSFGQLDGAIRSVHNGICDSSFALNSAIKDNMYNTAMNIQGVNSNLSNATCTQTYELANLINNVGTKVSNCCCELEQAIDSVKFEGERNKYDIVRASEHNTNKILEWLNNKEILKQNQEIAELKQDARTMRIIASQKPAPPVPAYLQPNPYTTFNPYYGTGVANNCTGF